MEIKLNFLKAENFKGIKEYTITPNGKNTTIRGRNATGKTTLEDAFTWLLFGKDSLGHADFALKTLSRDGEEIHNLNHAVEGALNIDGDNLILRKVFKEKYTKKRGQPVSEFTGHTTDYFIDGVPIQKKEWDDRLKDIIDEETFKLLISPTYFNDLHWQKRREILLQVCGDVHDGEVIESDESLWDLPEILRDRTIEEHRQMIKSRKKEIMEGKEDELNEFPGLNQIRSLIKENKRPLAEVIKADPKDLFEKIADLESEIQTIKDDTGLSVLRKEKAELETKLEEARTALERVRNAAGKEIDDKIDEAERKQRHLKKDLGDVNSELNSVTEKIERNETEMARLRNRFIEIDSEQFTGDTVCPTCGQNLPAGQVQEARKSHNQWKADKLAGINTDGKRRKTANEMMAKEKQGFSQEKAALEKAIADLTEKIKTLEADKETALQSAGKPERAAIDKLTVRIEAKKTEIGNYVIPNTEPLEQEISKYRTILAEIEAQKRNRERIKELTDEETTLAAEYEDLEKQLYLLDRFTVRKVEMLDEKINSKFQMARFKLFNILINGGIEDCCETTYQGVPFSSLNTGAQILVGCDIVKTLQDHYGIHCPLWLDHSEALSTKPDGLECQTIFLEVSQDEELEVEYQ